MTTTAQTVMQDVRNKCDQSQSQAVQDPVLLSWVNQAHRALYDLVIDCAVYNVTVAQFTVTPASTVTVDGKVGFPLPADWYRMNKLSTLASANQWVQVPAIHSSQLDTQWTGPMGNIGMVPSVGYYIEPPNLLLVPAVAASRQYTLRYYPTLADLVTGSSPVLSLFDQTGWWEWMSYDVCGMVAERLKLDSSPFSVRKAEVTARIQKAAPNRDVTFGQRLDPNRGRQSFGRGPMGMFR